MLRTISMMAAVLLTAANPAVAQHAGHQTGKAQASGFPPQCLAENARPQPRCASVITPAFDPKGALWLAWVQKERVYAAVSNDKGKSFSDPVQVTRNVMPVDDNGENRPKIAFGTKGQIFVTFTIRGKRRFTGDVLFSRSLDGGRTFSEPLTVSDEQTVSSLRFEDMGVGADGKIYIAWLDKRDRFAAEAANTAYTGAALYYTFSDDGGGTFAKNRPIQHSTCECCRTDMAMDEGLPSIVWRNIYGKNTRDHGFVRFTGPESFSVPTRISKDEWAVDACPHHGPALAVDGQGGYHATWYTEGAVREGIFYAHSGDKGKTFSTPRALGIPKNAPEHPHVVAVGDTVVLAWKEFDGHASNAMVMTSRDRGQTWTAPLQAASTSGNSDHPLLVSDSEWVFLSWQTAGDGWRLFPVARQ